MRDGRKGRVREWGNEREGEEGERERGERCEK